MVEHYCELHKTNFFKKGGMKGYAHPIAGTNDWCNEVEPQAKTQNPAQNSKPVQTSNSKYPAKPSTTTDAHVAFRGGIELLCNKVITPDSESGKKILKWLNEKL